MHPSREPRPSRSLLAASRLEVSITDLVAEYALRHEFHNPSGEAIEAIYSFPMPLDAAFLGMEAELGGERLTAVVEPRQRATGAYDDAIADGDSAVLLERLEAGTLCVSLGNLKPGERGLITLRFVAPLHCADGQARFSLPLVHRPRYGRSRLDELVTPAHDFAVEHLLDARIRVTGLLGRAPVSCASHAARFGVTAQGQQLDLTSAMLDRDLVLRFDLPDDFAGQARLVRDGDELIGMLSVSLPSGLQAAMPCDLCLVLDGSGSMGGDAIAQSRAALQAVTGSLGEADRIQVLRFGSSVVPLFRRPLKVSAAVRTALMDLSGTVNADLGGTEMGAALERALAALGTLERIAGRSRAIILVTDGAVQPQDIAAAKARCQAGGVAVFVVAVGGSAGVDVLEPLARETGARLERAVPAEPIDAGVMRQLRRARAGGPMQLLIDWGEEGARPLPLPPAFAGDALTAVAWLPFTGSREVVLKLPSGVDYFAPAAPEDAPALRALAGQMAYDCAPARDREGLALRYGLVVPETAAVLVKQRADGERVQGLPAVQRVAQMLPAGMLARDHGFVMHKAMSVHSVQKSYLDIPSFLRRQSDAPPPSPVPAVAEDGVLACFGKESDPFEPDARTLRVLLHALVRLLVVEQRRAIALADLLGALEVEHHAVAREWFEYHWPDGLEREDAIELLRDWLQDEPALDLDDDQEAGLALLLADV